MGDTFNVVATDIVPVGIRTTWMYSDIFTVKSACDVAAGVTDIPEYASITLRGCEVGTGVIYLVTYDGRKRMGSVTVEVQGGTPTVPTDTPTATATPTPTPTSTSTPEPPVPPTETPTPTPAWTIVVGTPTPTPTWIIGVATPTVIPVQGAPKVSRTAYRNSVDLSITPVEGAVTYQYRRQKQGPSTTYDLTDTDSTTLAVENLEEGITYFFSARAQDANERWGPWSNMVRATTGPPPVPELSSNGATTDTVHIAWDNIKGVGAYEMQRQDVGSADWIHVRSRDIDEGPVTMATIGDLRPGNLHLFRVRVTGNGSHYVRTTRGGETLYSDWRYLTVRTSSQLRA